MHDTHFDDAGTGADDTRAHSTGVGNSGAERTASPLPPPRTRWVAAVARVPFVEQLRDDVRQHESPFVPGFQAVATARLGQWLDEGRFPKPAAAALRPLQRVASTVVRNVYGIELPHTAKLGRRVRIAHQSGIVIHPQAVIGDDVVIRQNVTIGAGSGVFTGRREAPIVGNRVSIGAGATLVGPITIGDDAVIGPGAVVMTNVPAGATVLAQPPRVIRRAAPRASEAADPTGTSASSGGQS